MAIWSIHQEFKYEIERLTRELQDVKRKYYEQKRREQLAADMEHEDNSLGKAQAQQQLALAQAATTRFAGGGFAIRWDIVVMVVMK